MSSGWPPLRAAFGKLEDMVLPPSGQRAIESTIRLGAYRVKEQFDVAQ
jgi:hypothetical protein